MMDLEFLITYYKIFLIGAERTVIIAFFTVLLGIIFGVLMALMKLSKNKILKAIASVYIEFIRGTPLLVQLFIIYYGCDFPEFPALGDQFSIFLAGIITLTINSTAYIAEIIRGGIQSIDKGQTEAARSLGLTHSMTMRHIIIPQAFKNILPALGNEFITVIKESAIVSIIGVQELMFKAEVVVGTTFKPFAPYIVAAIMYFVMTFSLSKLLGMFERRMKLSD
jgi:polar amino acid transport system permease protein